MLGRICTPRMKGLPPDVVDVDIHTQMQSNNSHSFQLIYELPSAMDTSLGATAFHIQLLVSARFLGTSPPLPAGKNTQGQVSLSILLQLPLLSSNFVLLPAQSCFIPMKYCKQFLSFTQQNNCKQISLFYPGNMTNYSSKSGNS